MEQRQALATNVRRALPFSPRLLSAWPQSAPAHWAAALVLIAVLGGGILRFSNLAGVPPALNQDEAIYGYDAYSLLFTGRDHLGEPFPIAGMEAYGGFTPPLLAFIEAPVVGILGLHVEVLRGVTAAMGLLAIPLVYLLTLELFGRRLMAVLAAWIVAFSPWHVHMSRWAHPASLVTTTMALTIFLLAWSIRRRSGRGLVAAAGAAGLTALTYASMEVYVLLLLAAAAVAYRRQLLEVRREAVVYSVLVFIALVAPMLYVSTMDSTGRSRFDETSSFSAGRADVGVLATQYLSYYSPDFLFTSGDGDPMHSPPGFGVELVSALPFLVAGLFWLLHGVARPTTPWQRSCCLFILAALALYPIPGFLTLPSPHSLRAIHLILLGTIIAAAGAGALWDLAQRALSRTPTPVRRTILAALAVAALLPITYELVTRYEDYFVRYPTEVAAGFQYGLEQALGYASTHEGEYDEIWVTDTNQPYIYVLFFNAWPPDEVHNTLQVSRHPPDVSQVYAFSKYHFLSLPPEIVPAKLPLLETIPEPDGTAAYFVRGGTVPNHGRVLVIGKQ